jgi:hypothetical protein
MRVLRVCAWSNLADVEAAELKVGSSSCRQLRIRTLLTIMPHLITCGALYNLNHHDMALMAQNWYHPGVMNGPAAARSRWCCGSRSLRTSACCIADPAALMLVQTLVPTATRPEGSQGSYTHSDAQHNHRPYLFLATPQLVECTQTDQKHVPLHIGKVS